MNQNRRVLFYADLTRPFVPSDLESLPLGGSETALIRVARGLAAGGWSVVVAAHPQHGAGSYDGVAYLNVDDGAWRDADPDFVIVFRQLPHVLRSLPGKVRALWAHDHIGIYPEMSPGVRRSALAAAWRLGYSIFGRGAPTIVTVSEWLRQCFVRYARWPAAAVRAIHNAIEPSLFSATSPSRSGSALRVAYTSVPERGLSLLIQRIMPSIWRALPEVELHVFSYQPLETYRSLHSGSGGRIIFRGGLPQAELARELASFDLWIYPTDFPETSCIAAMEAQAAGLPVVTSRRYALQETVLHGQTGALVEGSVGTPAYVARFAGAVVDLLKDPNRRRRMGSRARERMLTEFTWDHVAHQWSELLQSLGTRDS